MVTAEASVDVRQFVVVAAAAVAVAAVALRRTLPRPCLVRWHCAAALLAINTLYGFVRGRGTYVGFIGQPLLVGCIVAGLRPQTAPDRLAAAMYAVVAIAGTLVEPLPDVAGLLYALYLAWQQSWAAVGAALCAAEAAVVAVLFATADTDEVTLRAEHFTWWSITLFAVWDLLLFLDQYLGTALANEFAGVVIAVAGVVGIGVLFMSANGCALLTDALNEVGDAAYLAGNFLMHYYPLVRLFAYQPTVRTDALLRGTGLCVIYSLTFPASSVYGCDLGPLPAYTPALMAAGGLAVTLAVTVLQPPAAV